MIRNTTMVVQTSFPAILQHCWSIVYHVNRKLKAKNMIIAKAIGQIATMLRKRYSKC